VGFVDPLSRCNCPGGYVGWIFFDVLGAWFASRPCLVFSGAPFFRTSFKASMFLRFLHVLFSLFQPLCLIPPWFSFFSVWLPSLPWSKLCPFVLIENGWVCSTVCLLEPWLAVRVPLICYVAPHFGVSWSFLVRLLVWSVPFRHT